MPVNNDNVIRQQALDTTKSFIVQAPAGSGKTTLLVDRYLALLATCSVPENILVMTFTNKAVDELKTRIIAWLKMAIEPALDTDLLALHQQQTLALAVAVINKDKQLNWQLITHLDRLNINTFDGLCHTLVQSQAVLTNLMPNTVIASDGQRKKIYQQSVIEILEMIEDVDQDNVDYRDAIIKVLTYLDNKTELFIQLFAKMLAKRDQWLRHIAKQPAQASIVTLKQTTDEICMQYLSNFTSLLNMPELKGFVSLASQSPKLKQHSQDFFAQFNDKTHLGLEDIVHIQALSQACLTQKGQWRTVAVMGFNKKNYAIQAEKLAQYQLVGVLPELIQQLVNIHHLPDINLNTQDKEILQAIIQVLTLCVAKLMVNFAKAQAVDFIAIASGAVALLADETNHNDTCLYLDHHIQHLLLDEFQDTSYGQFSLLQGLVKNWQNNTGKTLFLVGDPMQSIYRFREAQVGLFLYAKKNGIGNIRLTSIKLRQNFRSSPNIIQGNNALFSQVFPKEDCAESGAISYHHSVSPPVESTSNDNLVTCFGFKDNHTQAQKVCAIIQQIQQKNQTHRIAILVRSRSHLTQIYDQLNQHKIEFDAPKIANLSQHIHSQDLLCFCRALTNLDDKLSWLSLLRSPWCGLVLADLLQLANTEHYTIWQAINQYVINDKTRLTPDGQKRLLSLYQVLLPMINNQSSFSLVQCLSVTLQQLKVNDYLTEQDIAIQAIFLLQLAHNIEASPTNEVDIEQLTQSLYETYQPSTQQANVQIMTIYAAKGLEFDHIILPSLDKRPPSNSIDILPITELENGIIFAQYQANITQQSKTYQYLMHLEKTQAKHELMRLLYVAMTRAKQSIYLLTQIKNPDKLPTANTLLSLLWSYYKDNFIQSLTPNKETSPCIQIPPPLLRQTLLPETKILLPKTNIEQDFIAIDDGVNRRYVSLIGTLIHRYLEYHQKQADFPTKTTISIHLSALGLPKNLCNKQAENIQLSLRNLVQADFYHWLFTPRDSTQVEAVFYTSTQSWQKKIIIDRLFIDDNNLWIIDYKTQTPKIRQDQSDFIEQQTQEHQAQLQQYANILGDYYPQTIKTALCFISLPKLVFLPNSKK